MVTEDAVRELVKAMQHCKDIFSGDSPAYCRLVIFGDGSGRFEKYTSGPQGPTEPLVGFGAIAQEDNLSVVSHILENGHDLGTRIADMEDELNQLKSQKAFYDRITGSFRNNPHRP